MDKSEAAAYLGISTRTLERYTQQGKLQVKYEGAKTARSPHTIQKI